MNGLASTRLCPVIEKPDRQKIVLDQLLASSSNENFGLSFTPAVSKAALTNMRRKIWELHLCNWTQTELKEIARQLNPVLCGWIEYYGRYRPSALHPLYRHVNKTLVRWAMRKYKRFKGKRTSA